MPSREAQHADPPPTPAHPPLDLSAMLHCRSPALLSYPCPHGHVQGRPRQRNWCSTKAPLNSPGTQLGSGSTQQIQQDLVLLMLSNRSRNAVTKLRATVSAVLCSCRTQVRGRGGATVRSAQSGYCSATVQRVLAKCCTGGATRAHCVLQASGVVRHGAKHSPGS